MSHLCYAGDGVVIWDDDGTEQFIGYGAMAFARFCYWAALNDVEIYIEKEQA